MNIKKILISSTLILSCFTLQIGAEQSKELHQLFDKEWSARLERNPSMAAQFGDKSAVSKTIDVSAKAYDKWAKKTESFLKKLEKIDYSKLNFEDKMNYQIFKQQLEHRISQIKFKTYQMPFSADSGFHTSVMRMASSMPFKNEKDYKNYLTRLKHVPKYFDEQIKNMNAGLARGFSMPKVVMNGFSDVIKTAYAKKVEESSFWRPFKKMPESIDAKTQEKLKKKAKRLIAKKIYPAFENLYDYFENTYIPNTKKSLGSYEFPNGKEFYQSQVSHYTTLDLTPSEIHEIGLQEVKRIRGEMEDIIKELKFEGDFKDFVSFLRSSPQFYAKKPEDLIKHASYLAKKMDAKLPKLFTRLPRQPYAVEPVPDAIAPKYTTGRYVSAPLHSDRPGTYWVNTYALNKRPLYVLEALTLHEAVPGHHLQIALNKEIENIPNFRRHSYISAFGEGWALYCERLGLEVGFYQDHYSNFGRLTYEMWRAARLVIDTGIHAKGWTRDQAIKLLEDNSALSTHNIRTEVDRYISWPGQALSYKLGEIKIRELRAKAEKALGDKFDIRLFHDAILENGSIPLDILEQQVDRFIKKHQS